MDNNNSFYSKVFGWLFVGILVTFVSAYLVSNSYDILDLIFNKSGYWVVIIAQFGLCIFLSARIHKMSQTTAIISYVLYTLLTGVTLSSLLLIFEMGSIIFVFLATALVFGIFALIGAKTKMNLASYGTFLLVALVSLIVLEIINMFMLNNTVDMVLCIVGIVIFIGYIAYDMQHIKAIKEAGENSTNLAILGAFELYLDFINLFIKLLRLFGKERD
ncbi:MAG: Bax inhibitor-1/YccA family protein [Bacilli bacterium]|mgnify:CR=1 FL=1|nr:Bax inhibitor-1/YccA family protein [Bacilli bacterium]